MKLEKTLKIISILVIVVIAVFAMPFAKAEAVMLNNNPLLAEIKVDGEKLTEFDQFITDYVLAVDSSEEEIKIEATTDDPNASYQVIGDKTLKDGVNDYEIKVTAEDGISTYSYNLHVTKGDKDKANAKLSNLEIEGLELMPKFNEKDTNYLVEYDGYIDSLNITATPENDKAKVEILDNSSFNSTMHIVTIKVTAEDGITTKEYKISAKKAGESVENPSGLEEREEDEESMEATSKDNSIVWICAGVGVGIVAVAGIAIFVFKKKK